MCRPPSDRCVVVCQIDRRCLLEITQGNIGIAQPGSNQPMHRAAKGTAVTAARLVVAKVRPPTVTGEFLRQQPDKSHDVGLLDDLGALCSLPPKYHIHWH